ncbi:hypothetical protein O3M35_005008 [Rhynocoris fuscipes]|uniref:ATP synthase F0 subunit 8 n=1 Tax=Rhynocoris fuscipes TaxID=488301 RepID=A0AAW1DID7_9HEMI
MWRVQHFIIKQVCKEVICWSHQIFLKGVVFIVFYFTNFSLSDFFITINHLLFYLVRHWTFFFFFFFFFFFNSKTSNQIFLKKTHKRKFWRKTVESKQK